MYDPCMYEIMKLHVIVVLQILTRRFIQTLSPGAF